MRNDQFDAAGAHHEFDGPVPLDEHDDAFLGLPLIPLAAPNLPAFFDSPLHGGSFAWAPEGGPTLSSHLSHRAPLFGGFGASPARDRTPAPNRFLTPPATNQPFTAFGVQFDVAPSEAPEPDHDEPVDPVDVPMPLVPQGPAQFAAAAPSVSISWDDLDDTLLIVRRSHVEATIVYLGIIVTCVALLIYGMQYDGSSQAAVATPSPATSAGPTATGPAARPAARAQLSQATFDRTLRAPRRPQRRA